MKCTNCNKLKFLKKNDSTWFEVHPNLWHCCSSHSVTQTIWHYKLQLNLSQNNAQAGKKTLQFGSFSASAISEMIQQSLFSHLCRKKANKIVSLQQQHSNPANILHVIDVSLSRCLTACWTWQDIFYWSINICLWCLW